jgi:hypothetical protein
MTELAALQSLFQGYVIDNDDAAVPAFIGDASSSAGERLDVYYEAYRLRLLEVLREDFPGLRSLMSADLFNEMGLRYLEAYPPHHPSIRVFGKNMAEFLSTNGVYSEWVHLAEMARFEWARGLAFDGPDADVMALEEFGSLPAEDWPSLRVRFHPTLQRLRFTWNVGSIARAVHANESTPQPVRLDDPEIWAVWRRGVTVYFRSLDENEARAMDAFADGVDFAAACSVLCGWLDAEAVPAKMAGMLNQWITEGLVAK